MRISCSHTSLLPPLLSRFKDQNTLTNTPQKILRLPASITWQAHPIAPRAVGCVPASRWVLPLRCYSCSVIFLPSILVSLAVQRPSLVYFYLYIYPRISLPRTWFDEYNTEPLIFYFILHTGDQAKTQRSLLWSFCLCAFTNPSPQFENLFRRDNSLGLLRIQILALTATRCDEDNITRVDNDLCEEAGLSCPQSTRCVTWRRRENRCKHSS